MKANKWLLLFLAMCLVFSFAACGGGGGGSSDDPAGGGNGGGNGEPAIPVSDNYLCFTANENNCSISTKVYYSLTTTPSLEYSTDKGNWVPFILNSTTVDLPNTGDKVYIRATSSNATFSDASGWISFEISGSVAASGNIMSLLDKNCGGTSVPEHAFRCLFWNNSTLTTAPALPATTLEGGCYREMFQGCSSLTIAPELPAETLANNCYRCMFQGCSALTTAPDLPATTLEEYCYNQMFKGCSSLTEAPLLPATTLADCCYCSMFSDCSSLTEAPLLPATTLAEACYEGMFYGCKSLTTAPTLPATILATSCYNEMFSGCSVLITAPTLPATTLAEDCYTYMFYGCSSLSSITVHFATWSDIYTDHWVEGVAASGEFHCPGTLPDQVDDLGKYSKKPEGWTKVPLP